MPIRGSNGNSGAGGRNLDLIFQALMNVGNINPRLITDLQNDFRQLDKAVEMNAQEFTSTSKDIKRMKQTLIRLDGILRGLNKEFPDFEPLKQIVQEVIDAQNLYVKQIYENADKVAENDKAEQERNELLKELNRQVRQKISKERARERVRERLEQSYIRQEMEYMQKLSRLRDQRSRLVERNLAGFTRDELRSQNDFANRSERGTRVQRNDAAIGLNLRRDISRAAFSRIRLNAFGTGEPRNLIEQLQGLQTFQQGAQVRQAREQAERITDIRTTRNPISRVFKLIDNEIKSGQSRLIIKNIANGIVNSLKKQFEAAVVGILNAPFRALSYLFRTSRDLVGDATVGVFQGDDALNRRRNERSLRREEQAIENQDRYFQMFGAGINDLIAALEAYTNGIQRGGFKNQSVGVADEGIRHTERQINIARNAREGIGVAADVAEAVTYSQNEKIIDELQDIDEHTAKSGFTAQESNTFNAGQEQEQYRNSILEAMMQQTNIQMDILKVLQGSSPSSAGSSGGGSGILSGIVGGISKYLEPLKGVIPAIIGALGITRLGRFLGPVLQSAKTFLPRILGALGLGSGRALLGTLTRVLGPISLFIGGFMKTVDEYRPGDFLGNFMRLTENIAIDIPTQLASGLDMITELLFGFNLKLSEIPGQLFDSLNDIGSFLGNKLYEMIYGKSESSSNNTSTVPRSSNTLQNDEGQGTLPVRITSASDSRHRKGSKHYSGQALDLTPVGFGGIPYNGESLETQNPSAAKAYRQIHQQLETMGLRVVDEYSGPGKTSQYGSGRHIHVEGTQEQINDLLNRAEVVKGSVIPFQGTSNKRRAGQNKLNSARNKYSKSVGEKNKVSTITQNAAMTPNINVPAPNVNVNVEKNQDLSFDSYLMFQTMMG